MTISILQKLAGMKKVDNANRVATVEMTDIELAQCKIAIKSNNRGYNVLANKWNRAKPYRVSINHSSIQAKGNWANYGEVACVHAAAAVGSIVSIAYFGDKAVAGEFDMEVAEASAEFQSWLLDERNQDVIAKANGEEGPFVADGENPF